MACTPSNEGLKVRVGGNTQKSVGAGPFDVFVSTPGPVLLAICFVSSAVVLTKIRISFDCLRCDGVCMDVTAPPDASRGLPVYCFQVIILALISGRRRRLFALVAPRSTATLVVLDGLLLVDFKAYRP